MVFNNKKGQAAIEFLMTYGWMLLVVLIVGALIFSFVDFGSLLPNKVQLSNNLLADSAESYAEATGDTSTLVFKYNGIKKVRINASNSIITSSLDGTTCTSTSIKNADTNTGTVGSGATTIVTTAIAFLSGQTGVIVFDCSTIGGTGLLKNDVLEGKIRVTVESVKTGVRIPSQGNLRLAIAD